ncbi:MAG: ATP-binding protein [Candidatus Electronema sp. V4]|uniref:ATP-binding protein n=1 Tax=Candidatus Electronema sp. V4 TaxID=3454756 RepID=UPI00405548B5
MNLNTDLHGRLRNTALPAKHGLLPLFEAVVNSIHAIEDARLSSERGRITIQLIRTGQMSLESKPMGDIIGFKIIDNGIGFNDENMTSFSMLDSKYKTARGGRGVGRLLWLKAFQRATVESIYVDKNSILKRRSFTFDSSSGVSEPDNADVSESEEHLTVVYLSGFIERYRQASPKTAKGIAKDILEHCLWYFVRPSGVPQMVIEDGSDTISLDDVCKEHMVSPAATEAINLKGNEFQLIHIKLSASSTRNHSIAYCAANRLVIKENIRSKIPGLYGNLHDEAGDFVYECYVSSPLLDEHVRSERTGFDIEEEPWEIFTSQRLSKREIREAITACAAEFLSKYLEKQRRLGKERVTSFIAKKAPRYRPILHRIPEEQLFVNPDISDKELDVQLHKHLAEIERKMLEDGHDVMRPQAHESFPDYSRRLNEYLNTAEDIKQADLANYVSHRRVIIDLLEMAVQKEDGGRYAREDLIHTLIMPMRKDSNELPVESCNLWLIDERLAFHDYLASDKPLNSMPITGSLSGKEPDIVALNVFDNPMLVSEGSRLPPASLVVIELKRPMRNDAASGEEKDPIEQALGYLDRIRQGTVKTAAGRPIPDSENIPGFCYVICDLTPTIVQRCKMHDGIRTSDGLGYFFYQKTYKAYVEVISFDRLVNAAKERNKAFFDKLGLPTT